MPFFFSEDKMKKWLDCIAAAYGRTPGNLSFVYCNDDRIIDVNREFLQHDYYTDVITFDYCRKNVLNGDIFISLDTVHSNSVKFGVPYEEEFNRVFCHSVLHLIGYKDKSDDDAAEMRRQESNCLNLLKSLS